MQSPQGWGMNSLGFATGPTVPRYISHSLRHTCNFLASIGIWLCSFRPPMFSSSVPFESTSSLNLLKAKLLQSELQEI